MKRLGKILVENVSSDSDFMKLLAISKGKLNPKDVDFDMEDLYKVDKDYVYFWFDEEEDLLTKFFDYDEYEAKDILWMYYRPGDYEFLDSYSIEEDWNEGYVYGSLSEDNKKEIKEVLDKIGVKVNDEISDSEISKILSDLFPDLATNLQENYWNAREGAIINGIEEYMNNEFFQELYGPLKFEEWGYRFKQIKIPISQLALMYSMVGSVNDSIEDIIETYIAKKVSTPNNPREDYYSYEDNDYFNETFKRESTWSIERLTDSLDDFDELSELSKIGELYEKIKNKYGFDKPILVYETDTSKTYLTILNLVPEENKVLVQIDRSRRGAGYVSERKKVKIKLSTLESLINNYQLFDVFND